LFRAFDSFVEKVLGARGFSFDVLPFEEGFVVVHFDEGHIGVGSITVWGFGLEEPPQFGLHNPLLFFPADPAASSKTLNWPAPIS
jgi:hypothetical protein